MDRLRVIRLLFFAVLAVVSACGDDGTPGNQTNVNGNQAVCGNGVLETGEQCDEGSANTDEAPDACRTTCRNAYCGDGVIDTGELCDTDALAGKDCATQGFTKGTLACSPTSCDLDTSGCTTCGNDTAEGAVGEAGYEACDRADLRGATCPSLGFPAGPLACLASCTYDTSACTGTTPVITAIDGTGSALAIDPRPEDQAAWDGTANKIPSGLRIAAAGRELVIQGAHLAGVTSAVATGTAGQGVITFEVQPGGSDTMVRVKFPLSMAVTAGGLFALTLTTVAGQANAQVFFLQGEAGQCSNTVTGDLTVTGSVNASGSLNASGATITGTASLATAQVQDLQVTGAYALPPCPEGYTEDLTAFGGLYPGVHVCVSIASGDQMVKVGSFWIDRYEASLWSGATCSGTQYGGTDDYPASFPDHGNFTTPVYACSLPGVTPSRLMTWFQAEQACALAGKRLCSNDEWQLAVAGTYDEGTAEANGTSQCHIATTNTGPRQTGQAGATPSSTLHCISAWGAEDLIGNVWEWVADWYPAGYPWQTGDGQEAAGVWGASYFNDSTWNVNGSVHHAGTPWVDGIPAAGLRGGAWSYGSKAGAFSMYLGYGPSNWSTDIGARCCRGR